MWQICPFSDNEYMHSAICFQARVFVILSIIDNETSRKITNHSYLLVIANIGTRMCKRVAVQMWLFHDRA